MSRMFSEEYLYLSMLDDILHYGDYKGDRTGTGTYSKFGYQLRFDLSKGFPLLTTKKLHWKSIVHELLWFIAGRTDVKYLKDRGVTIWNAWERPDGTIGPGYGKQWRSWNEHAENRGIDQLYMAVEQIKNNPDSRRIIVSAWNPEDIPFMALPPCHCLFQFYVSNNKLSCHLYQRSADAFLGVPFNIASYALLTMMIAHVSNLKPGDFIHSFGDIHVYSNHKDQVEEQLKRQPLCIPQVEFNPEVKSLFDFKFEDIVLKNYEAHPSIKAPVAV